MAAVLNSMTAFSALVLASPAGLVAMDDLVTACGRSSATGFAFGNPVSIERRHVPVVAAQKYWAAAKTDGIRVTVAFAGQHAVVRNRAGVTRGLALTAPAFLFKGTLLDAEFVVQHGSQTPIVLVFDAAAVGGSPCDQLPLSQRLQLIRDVCAGIAPAFTAAVSTTVPAPAFVAKCMAPLWQGPVSALDSHGCPEDGVVLTPELEPCARPGTAYSVFKLKPMHTLDLWCVDGCLTFGRCGEMQALTTVRPEVHCEGLAAVKCPVDGCVLEVAITSVTPSRLEVTALGLRPDKICPNSHECVVKTLVSAADIVTLADVVNATQAVDDEHAQ